MTNDEAANWLKIVKRIWRNQYPKDDTRLFDAFDLAISALESRGESVGWLVTIPETGQTFYASEGNVRFWELSGHTSQPLYIHPAPATSYEPSEAEVEAGAEALFKRLYPATASWSHVVETDPNWTEGYRAMSRAALIAAHKARSAQP